MSAAPELEALGAAVRAGLAAAGLPDAEATFERPRNRAHGDWSTNVALALAKPAGLPPREVAQRLVAALGQVPGVASFDIAGPGFINFRLDHAVFERIVREAVLGGDAWGTSGTGSGRRAQVEFVSANPTGPLHVGHGRWAAAGDAVANLLEATGWKVEREYYLNDFGGQLDLFTASVEALLRGAPVPADGYRGAYVRDLADQLAAEGVDTDQAGEQAYQRMVASVRATLEALGVVFDVWFSERQLHSSGVVLATVQALRERGEAYEADGALWLRTSAYGDDKDRVLVRADGRPTYFAADCAYMASKVERGFELAVYLLGADHHGYVSRLKAIADAEGVPAGRVEVIIGQLVNLFRGGLPVRMSKRTGDFITLDELLEEVGPDAARYTFLRASLDVTLDFDIDRVVREDRDNPVYYIQYSHARIAGIMRTAHERDVQPGRVQDAPLELLQGEAEQELIRRIGAWPEAVAYAAQARAPHRVARYAEELAEGFHRFYTESHVVTEDQDLTRARYWLCVAARQTLVNALGILGVSAPERM